MKTAPHHATGIFIAAVEKDMRHARISPGPMISGTISTWPESRGPPRVSEGSMRVCAPNAHETNDDASGTCEHLLGV